MKLIYCLAAIAVAPSLLGATTLPTNALTPGVDRHLAQWRKATVADVRYALSFDLPQTVDASVNGDVTVTMTLKEPQPIVLDFKADPQQLLSVSVNGNEATDYRFADEHIVIPAEMTTTGGNDVSISFVAGNRPLNRNEGYLYTLLVPDRARTLFPCFDQPDIKAEYSLQLQLPSAWSAVSNTKVIGETAISADRKSVMFAPTEPLSSYLFSFVAGKFFHSTKSDGRHTISAYYRETAPGKVAQIDGIFDQIFAALDWLEDFTAIPYPFAKYDFVILPGFQFGGMEHTGATLYNDRMLLLGDVPTPDEELARSQIIAHETAHMWFGDYVTMDWFDDVWTKEVFANYFAARIAEPMYPSINHNLYRQRTFAAPALAEDRTDGTTAIQQPLDNLQSAGLIYNNIIYDKAPVMMFKLVDIMGEDPFKAGIREYLRSYAYGNANWDDLIDILSAATPELKEFSNVWVKQKGMPTITCEATDGSFAVRQTDPYGRDLLWPQQFAVTAISADDTATVTVDLREQSQHIALPFSPQIILPNTDARGYGYFLPDATSLKYILDNWSGITDDAARQSLLMTLWECYLHGKVDVADLLGSLLAGVETERNQLIACTVLGYIGYAINYADRSTREEAEIALARLVDTLESASARLVAARQLMSVASLPTIVETLYQHWLSQDNHAWSEDDYTTLAYELAMRYPADADSILAIQRARITNADRLKKFDYISRACTPDTARLDELFAQLHQVENRSIEPYALQMLYYINHPTRQEYDLKYIYPALEMLQEIQLTGDIFFPGQWVKYLLKGHFSEASRAEVDRFLADHPDYPELLRNKIHQAAFSPIKQ